MKQMLLPVENVYKHHECAIVYTYILECRRSAGHVIALI